MMRFKRFGLVKLGSESEMLELPSGTPFLEIREGDVSFIIARFEGSIPDGIQKLLFSDEKQRTLSSCWDRFLPPLVLAGIDVQKRYHKNSRSRNSLSLELLRDDFTKAVDYYLENQSKFFLAKLIKSVGDVELQENCWLWVVGYCRKEHSIWEEDRVLLINLEGSLDSLPIDCLEVSRPDLLKRFSIRSSPYYGRSESLSPDFCPVSLL